MGSEDQHQKIFKGHICSGDVVTMANLKLKPSLFKPRPTTHTHVFKNKFPSLRFMTCDHCSTNEILRREDETHVNIF